MNSATRKTPGDTGYIHAKKGWPVIISQALGCSWCVYLQKPNGSLQRCKQFIESGDVEMIKQEFRDYVKRFPAMFIKQS